MSKNSLDSRIFRVKAGHIFSSVVPAIVDLLQMHNSHPQIDGHGIFHCSLPQRPLNPLFLMTFGEPNVSNSVGVQGVEPWLG